MSKRTDPDELAKLTFDELDHRLAVCRDRVEERAARCHAEERDLTAREADLCRDDRAEMAAIKEAVELKSRDADYSQRVTAALDEAISTRSSTAGGRRLSPLFPSAQNLELLERARVDYRSVSVIEERATVTTADLGTATEYSANGLQAPNTLWRLSGIPTTQPPAGLHGTVPKFTLTPAAALVPEGTEHPEYDDVVPDTVTMARAGRWSDLTAEALVSSTLAEVSAAHARLIARDIDLATVTKLQAAPSSGVSIDEALTTVAGECSVDVSRLWIVGDAAAIAGLAGNATFQATSGPPTSKATRCATAAPRSTPRPRPQRRR